MSIIRQTFREKKRTHPVLSPAPIVTPPSMWCPCANMFMQRIAAWVHPGLVRGSSARVTHIEDIVQLRGHEREGRTWRGKERGQEREKEQVAEEG